MSRELPVLFSDPMIRAILEGRKTVTRRAMKPQPRLERGFWKWSGVGWSQGMTSIPAVFGHSLATGCPYGQVGDRLWMREAWRAPASLDARSGTQIAEDCLAAGYRKPWCPIRYEADGALNSVKDWHEFGSTPGEAIPGRYRHARFMPRWASRLTLEVTAVRVERLCDITEEDARREGLEWNDECLNPVQARNGFADLWDSLAKVGTRWAEDPWVWVVEFARIDR